MAKRKHSIHWLLYTGADRIACGKRQVIGAPTIRTTDDKHKATCNTCRRIGDLEPVAAPTPAPTLAESMEQTKAFVTNLRLQYAASVGLLCELALHLSDRDKSEQADYLDSIEQAVKDFCTLTGWTYRRVLHRIEVFPPQLK